MMKFVKHLWQSSDECIGMSPSAGIQDLAFKLLAVSYSELVDPEYVLLLMIQEGSCLNGLFERSEIVNQASYSNRKELI